jgi:uridine kinase
MGFTPSSKAQQSPYRSKLESKAIESAFKEDLPETSKLDTKKQPATYIPRMAPTDNSKTYKPKTPVDGLRNLKGGTYRPTNVSKVVVNGGANVDGNQSRSEVVKFTPEDVTIRMLRHKGNIQIPLQSSNLTGKQLPRLTLTKADGSVGDVKYATSPLATSPSSSNQIPSSKAALSTAPSDVEPVKQPDVEMEVKLVGISGCSSSGKSTLAYLLSEIFNPSQEGETGKRFLTQDDFFRPKKDIPRTKFTEPDSQFVRESAKVSKEGLYTFREVYEGKVKKWEIEGPNTDGPAAIDFKELRQAVTELKQTGTISAALEKERSKRGLGVVAETGETITGTEAQFKPLRMQIQQAKNEDLLHKKYNPLISELRDQVKTAMKDKPIKFAFVEGFLLFVNPNAKPSRKEPDWDRHLLHDTLNIPIFLPTSKTAAKKRRFSRLPYKDPPEGDRVPGQMWMSEGYFEDVAWAGYLEEFGWLLKRLVHGRIPGCRARDRETWRVDGVWVRDGDDVGVEETLRWAVGLLLEEVRQPSKRFVTKASVALQR